VTGDSKEPHPSDQRQCKSLTAFLWIFWENGFTMSAAAIKLTYFIREKPTKNKNGK
jgi:hypothetical protein